MATTVMAPAPATQAFSLGSVLAGAWDTALGTFNRWIDSELGAEVALEQESINAQAQQEAEQAPVGAGGVHVAGYGISWAAIGVALGAAALLFMLLRR